MWEFFRGFVDGLFSSIIDALKMAVDFVFGITAGVAQAVWGSLYPLLPGSWQTYLGQTPWEPVTEFFAALQYLFPIREVFAISVTSFSIAAGVRFVRWVMAVMPGVRIFGNGIGPFTGA